MTATTDPEEFPTRQDLLRAGLVALLTGVTGFTVTYWIFVRPTHKERALAAVDRRSAETSQPAAYKESGQQAAAYSFPYGSAGGYHPERRQSKLVVQMPDRKPLAVVAPATTPSPTPKPSALPLPDSPYQQRSSHLQVKDPRTSLPNPPPVAAERPTEVSFAEAWKRVEPGWVTFGDGKRLGGEGVMVAPGLVLTTLSCFNFTGGRGYLGGQFISASLEASDPAQDLALLKAEGSLGVPVPISPDSPASGQIMICGDTVNFGSYQEVRSRGPAGSWSGYYGWNAALMGGSPLINNRGEVVALSLPRPNWNSMSWNLAIPSSALQAFVSARPAPAGMPAVPLDNWVKALHSRIAVQPERALPSRANSRVLAGQAMGNYPLGMTAEALKKELGPGEILEQKGGFLRILYSAPRLTFTLADGVVVAIETDYNFYTTEAGWAAGSRLTPEELRTQLPASVAHMRDNFDALCSAGLELVFQGGTLATVRVVVP